jgi:hypothetical protein
MLIMSEVTRLLAAIDEGDPQATAELLPLAIGLRIEVPPNNREMHYVLDTNPILDQTVPNTRELGSSATGGGCQPFSRHTVFSAHHFTMGWTNILRRCRHRILRTIDGCCSYFRTSAGYFSGCEVQ